MQHEEDIIIGKHHGAMIFADENTGAYYWEDANGVVGGEDFDTITDCMEWLSDKIWIFALVGTGKVDRMLQVFEYAFRRHGIKHFLIDSNVNYSAQ